MSTIKKRVTNRSPGITVYVTPTCVNCPKTLHLLKHHRIPHTVVDLTQNKEAYAYVTQDLGYKQAPIVIVSDGVEQVSWSGHHQEHIQHWIIDRAVEPHMQLVPDVSIDDRMTRAAANTTSVIRNSGLGGHSTGPHLHVKADTGPELQRFEGGEPL